MSAGYLGIRAELWQNIWQIARTGSVLWFPVVLVIEVGRW